MQNPSNQIRFVHPVSKAPLYPNEHADLCKDFHLDQVLFRNLNGSYDFITNKDRERERTHYDRVYKREPEGTDFLSVAELKRMWDAEPELPTLLTSLGDLKGRSVLILGNGCSLKEFLFLMQGAYCVSTDLSFTSVERLRECFKSSELGTMFHGQIEYHAIDALNLPFPDRSFDIVYGCAFVHHLQDLERFFSEVARCLRPGGICRFLDDGFSPIWQLVKKTVLRPLQIYSHWKTGISPEDLAATRKGGYARDEAREIMEKHGFNHMVFIRKYFFEYLLRRGSEKLGGRFMLPVRPLLRALDELLENKTGFIEEHGLRLIWGFNKPDTGSV